MSCQSGATSGTASTAAWVTVCFPFRRNSRAPHTSWATSGMFGLFYFSLWGLLGAPKCDASKIEWEGAPWPLIADVSTINTTTNRKLAFLMRDNIREGARPRRNVWEGRYPIDWGGESGDEIIEKINMSRSSGATDDEKHTITS